MGSEHFQGEVHHDIGWISYWNLLPFRHELLRVAHEHGLSLSLREGHPSTVNGWLHNGEVALAPASSIALVQSPHLSMALPLGIASDGPVQSVYLGVRAGSEGVIPRIAGRQRSLREVVRFSFNEEPNDGDALARLIVELGVREALAGPVPKVVLSKASAASAALVRVLMYLWFGCDITEEGGPARGRSPEELELVIGDEALLRRREFAAIIDLGEAWHELTGLPFVFGLWQTTRVPIDPVLAEVLDQAAARAEEGMRSNPERYMPRPYPDGGIDLGLYWSCIQYRLTERHLRALRLYYGLYRALGAVNFPDRLRFGGARS